MTFLGPQIGTDPAGYSQPVTRLTPEGFLEEHANRRALTLDDRSLAPVAAFDGRGAHALEVAVATAPGRPRAEDIRRAWKARQAGAPSPLMLVVAYEVESSWKASICGPVGDEPPVESSLDLGLVERIAQAALNQPSRHQAIRFLGGILSEVEAELPGIRNHGMLATHELREGVPQRGDWDDACDQARPLLHSHGRELVEKLGFNIEHHSTATTILSVGAAHRAVAVFLDENEEFEAPATRFGDTSPVTHALAYADQAELPWVVVTRGPQIRLYAARPDVGVGRKGRADTYVEANLALIPDDRAGYVTLLFSADALKTDGTLTEILEASRDHATALGVRLRDRVYEDAVPSLALALASRHTGALDEAALDAIYEQAQTRCALILRIQSSRYVQPLLSPLNSGLSRHLRPSRCQRSRRTTCTWSAGSRSSRPNLRPREATQTCPFAFGQLAFSPNSRVMSLRFHARSRARISSSKLPICSTEARYGLLPRRRNSMLPPCPVAR